MKKGFTLLALVCASFMGGRSYAQSFDVQHDTVYHSASGSFSITNNINNLTSAADTLQWKVVSTNWPADWIATLGICDNMGCYSDVWPTNVKESTYMPGWGDFHVQADLTSVSSPGPYILRIRFNNKVTPGDTMMQTYIISKSTTGTPKVKAVVNNEVTLYPNPASNTLNVVYDASADVKNVAIYSIIGRQMNVFRVTDDNSASLNIENIPSGVYFVRLLNSRGDIVATRKFTKQ